ncbi:MAG TPA: dipeptidase PepE [Bacteroidales bacterium]|nr:dipeptidase PepE [Bacteroidales bacterium]HPT01737.1 dipeptidase PepE [Bacteroidales bacterium]
MKLLLLSNSTNAGEEYLGWPRKLIIDFLQDYNIKTAVFIPYAGVTINNNDYEARVDEVFGPMGCKITSVHKVNDPVEAVKSAECIIVGGGNTFRLVQLMYDKKLMEPIRQRVMEGVPFIGWSAGSNVACPSMKTTNDMPIVQPLSLDTLNLVPFQINPHYLDSNPEGHGGETREQRIIEFLEVNRKITVVGLREACALRYMDSRLHLLGNRPMRVFRYHTVPVEYEPGSDIDFLLSPAI